MLAFSQAMAGEIKEDRSDSVVTVTGEIVKGDSDKFDAVVAAAAHHPLVELNSPGGDLMEGFAIGETMPRPGASGGPGRSRSCWRLSSNQDWQGRKGASKNLRAGTKAQSLRLS
jgi:hypothetical protein